MKRRYSLENLDCAHCAAKMEEAANKIDGVVECKINFLTQKLTLEANEENYNNVFDEVKKACLKVERDLVIK